MGIVVILMSLAAGYGLCAGCGVFFISLHQVLPFIIVGIGVDDVFIIVSSFDDEDHKVIRVIDGLQPFTSTFDLLPALHQFSVECSIISSYFIVMLYSCLMMNALVVR
jgi:hypothetical protein